jgi:excinuclease ABC subunit A
VPDVPSLHPVDIRTLIAVFDRLLDDGATIVVIDHVDDRPQRAGGPDGGRIVARGAPAEVAADPKSVTGPWLAAHLSHVRP